MIGYALILVAVVGASVATLRLVERLARKWAILDIPNARSSHSTPIPRGGGIAIVVPALVGWALAAFADAAYSVGGAVCACAALLIAGVGWRDDVESLSVRSRFTAQSLAAVAVIAALGPMHLLDVPSGGSVELGWGGTALTFIWIVGLTNAYNFMDGIDGIAGAQGVAASLAWVVVASIIGDRVLAVFALSLALSCGVFLTRNWAPAHIFMGDVGSAFLGFVFAIMPLTALHDGGHVDAGVMPFVAVAAVWPFVFDASLTFVRRYSRRERVTQPHRTHLYQRLTASGFSHRQVSTLYASWAAVSGAAAITWVSGPRSVRWSLLSVIGLSAAFVWCFVVRAERMAARVRS